MNQTQTAISYKIYKDKYFVGYLIGSLHHNWNPQDHENIKAKFIPLLEECSVVFLECDLPQSILMPYGYEKAILELLENKSKKYNYFESISIQRTLLSGAFLLGTKIKFFPWHNYKIIKKAPKFFLFLSKIVLKFIVIHNIIYNFINNGTHTVAYTQHLKKTQEHTLAIFQNFSNNFVTSFDAMSGKMLLMTERNILYIETITKQSIDEKLFIMVGAGHLPSTLTEGGIIPNNDGMVYLLEKSGYTLEAINI